MEKPVFFFNVQVITNWISHCFPRRTRPRAIGDLTVEEMRSDYHAVESFAYMRGKLLAAAAR